MSSKPCICFAAVPFFALIVACSGASPDGSGSEDESRLEDPTTTSTTDDGDPPADVSSETPSVPAVVASEKPEPAYLGYETSAGGGAKPQNEGVGVRPSVLLAARP
jgi:hypothetical protein